MAFPNANYSDIIATTIQSRSRKIADNVTKNNALLTWLEKKGNIKSFSGGNVIIEELSFAENGNGGFYSGYDLLPVAAQDVISAAEYQIKQAAVPVVMSGLEMLQNAGKEQMIDLMDSRMAVAEATLANIISTSLYSDGTGSGGKEITGLNAAVPVNPATGTYGGIDRSTAIGTFWRSQIIDTSGLTAATLPAQMNLLWSRCVRGSDRPNLILSDSTMWNLYVSGLQSLQRFSGTESAGYGFPTLKFMDADIVLDGGIGGACPVGTMFFLNTKYIKYRPHSARNMVPLSPNKRYAVNQDAEVQIIGWAGNLTTSGARFQGRLDNN